MTVNRVTDRLFLKYRRPEDYLSVPLEELERDIRPTGTFRQKARNLRGAMRMLIEEYDGKVPTQLDELVRLPGVGRKIANVVASERGATQGIVVDTHVRRLSQRLGLTRQSDPAKIERDLQPARSARRLGALSASADLARTPGLHRAIAPVLRVRSCRPVPIEPDRRGRRHDPVAKAARLA